MPSTERDDQLLLAVMSSYATASTGNNSAAATGLDSSADSNGRNERQQTPLYSPVEGDQPALAMPQTENAADPNAIIHTLDE